MRSDDLQHQAGHRQRRFIIGNTCLLSLRADQVSVGLNLSCIALIAGFLVHFGSGCVNTNPDEEAFYHMTGKHRHSSGAGEDTKEGGDLTLCTPNCSGRDCGDDGCGGGCGTCGANLPCNDGGTCQAPVGTWYDSTSRLLWQVMPPEMNLDFSEAQTYCAELLFAGFSDWELPSIDDLRSLIRGCAATMTAGSCKIGLGVCLSSSCWEPSCRSCPAGKGPGNDGNYWPEQILGPCCHYWSSSPVDDSWGHAWGVLFLFGSVEAGYMHGDGPVRCVRGRSATVCSPTCDGKNCGPDSCGGSCGSCYDTKGGIDQGLCRSGVCCEPSCVGRKCGDDGCGGTCGECGEGLYCGSEGQCEPYGEAWVDPISGLTWQVTPTGGLMFWSAAQIHCDDLVLAGLSNWRLPSINELRSLIRGCPATMTGGSCNIADDGCLAPSCQNSSCDGCELTKNLGKDGMYWPYEVAGSCCGYWSISSTEDTDPVQAWGVGFGNGSVFTIGNDIAHFDGYVRCVVAEF